MNIGNSLALEAFIAVFYDFLGGRGDLCATGYQLLCADHAVFMRFFRLIILLFEIRAILLKKRNFDVYGLTDDALSFLYKR